MKTMSNKMRIVAVVLLVSLSVSEQYECDPNTCRPPDCLCASRSPPNNMPVSQVPQMVVFTLDDVIAGGEFYNKFQDLFTNHGKNPNQCPMAVTFFASLSSGTDECVLEKVITKGHEVAAYSIDQRTSKGWWKGAEEKDWTSETAGFKTKLSGKIQTRLIQGWRTPFLIAGGDTQFEVLSREKFLYDSTLIVDNVTDGQYQLPYWPFTLDYGSPLECSTQKCPTGNYKGFWEVPVQIHHDMEDGECLFLDRCNNPPKNDEQMFELFWKNFKRHNGTNRAPIIFSLQVAWLKSSNITEDGFKRFMKELNKLNDVYVVTMAQMIEWLKKPTPLNKIINFEPWQCHFRWRGKVTCDFDTKDSFLNQYWWLEVPILTLIFLILFARDREDS